MPLCFHVSDLHGSLARYRALFAAIREGGPDVVLLGGDLTPSAFGVQAARSGPYDDFLQEVIVRGFRDLREEMGEDYPHVLVILGNDDSKLPEPVLKAEEEEGTWHYLHGGSLQVEDWTFYGYSYVPPTPFRLKDWERYDVSRFVDPGCVSPEDGVRTGDTPDHLIRYATIAEDLVELAADRDLAQAVMLFHTPPYQTRLDRAALDGRMIDHVPLDVHVGSIALRRFIEERQPAVTLHGHIHEAASITGHWQDRIGETRLFGAAHDGPELAIVRFDPADPGGASRVLV